MFRLNGRHIEKKGNRLKNLLTGQQGKELFSSDKNMSLQRSDKKNTATLASLSTEATMDGERTSYLEK